MANLKAEFQEHLSRPGVKMTRRCAFVCWKVTWKANVVSFDENVSYSSTLISLYERNEQLLMNETAIECKTDIGTIVWYCNFIFELCFFKKKYLLVGASGMLRFNGWVSEWEMYVCHTNQIGSTINSQSNFLLWRYVRSYDPDTVQNGHIYSSIKEEEVFIYWVYFDIFCGLGWGF